MIPFTSYARKVNAANKTDFVFHLPHLAPRAQKFIKERAYTLILNKGEILVKQGETTDCLFYIREGAVREFVTVEKEQYTTMLLGKNECSPNFMDFYFQQPIRHTVQTGCDSIIDVIHLKDIWDLITEYPKTYRSFETFVESMIPKRIELSVLLRWDNKRKFNYFRQHFKHLLQLVPHLHIANFLGMPSESFTQLFNYYHNQEQND